jgi:hypothetical protein
MSSGLLAACTRWRSPADLSLGYVTQTGPRDFVFRFDCLRLVDSVAFCLLSPAGMQRTGRTRCFYARLRSYSVWLNHYRFLIAQRHTAHQKKTIMVLGFLASRNHFRNYSAGRNCVYRVVYL